MLFLTPNQQCQSTEGTTSHTAANQSFTHTLTSSCCGSQTRYKIGHFGDVLPRQFLGLVLNKINPINKKQTCIDNKIHTRTHARTHIHLTALCPKLPGWASTRKVKPIWILLKQETVSGSGISRAICKSAPRTRQITTPAPHYSVFTGRMPFLPPNQQCQSTEGDNKITKYTTT